MTIRRFAVRSNSSWARKVFLPKMIVFALSTSLVLWPFPVSSYATETGTDNTTNQSAQPAQAQITETLNKLPLYFEVNAGQLAHDVKFVSRSGNRSFLLTSNAIELTPRARTARLATREDLINRHALLRREVPDNARQLSANDPVIKLRFAQANANPRVEGLELLPGTSNYLVGANARQWRQGVAHFAKVKYHDLYPGIDLVYYGNQQQLEYDFVVAPGVNPQQIKIAVAGTQNVRLAENGDLILGTDEGALIQQKPVVYQESAGMKRTVESRYKLLGHNEVGFELGSYDTTQALVIDPVLGFATTFGTADDTYGNGIATDLAGNSYITGVAYSVRTQAIGRAGVANVFVTKLNAAGQLVYNTYIGSSGEDVGFAIDVDRNGNAYVTGQADINDFPVTQGAFQTRFGGICDAFVLKLNARGNDLVYSGFLGGTREDTGTGIAVDQEGQAYVVGETSSANFPTADPLYRFGQAPTEAFVSKVSQSGARLVYSTALTGTTTNPEGGTAAMAIDVNRRGDAVVVGFTTAGRFPRVNALQDALNGTMDAFVTRINRNGNRLDFSTYLGGAHEDAAFAVALDAAENVYVTGLTNSADYPTVNALQSFLGGAAGAASNDDAFVTKLIRAGDAVVYSTYLGGSQGDAGFGIAVNNIGEAHVVGRTRSTNFPLEDTLPIVSPNQALNGGIDGFVCKLRANGRVFSYSHYAGGRGEEKCFGVAVWGNRIAHVTGLTTSVGWLPNNLAPPKLAGAASAFAFQVADSANFAIASVSGASYERSALACDSIVSVFGEGISSGTEGAESLPLPTDLGGIKVVIKDSAGVEFQAQLFYVSPFQINYHVPAAAALGPATVQVINENGDVFTENTRIESTMPGLFTADASGKGLAAAYLTRVKAGKIVGDEPITRLNAQGQVEAIPIDLGAEDEELFLVVFGTGIRHRNPNSPVTAKIADTDTPVLYAGRQADYVGLDQVNLRLPRSLKGRGLSSLVLTADGKTGNAVQIHIK